MKIVSFIWVIMKTLRRGLSLLSLVMGPPSSARIQADCDCYYSLVKTRSLLWSEKRDQERRHSTQLFYYGLDFFLPQPVC